MLIRSILVASLAWAGPCLGSIHNLEQVYCTEDSFKRIAEYFTGLEDEGDRSILRSHPDNRAGHYVKFNISKPYAVHRCQLEVLGFGAKEPTTYSFKVQQPWSVENPIYLGLTGPEWRQKAQPPIAYKVILLDAAGNILTSAKSFLWGDG